MNRVRLALLALTAPQLLNRREERAERDQAQRQHVRLTAFPSAPFPQRLSAQDTRTYQQPLPLDWASFQSFFTGNQLPGVHMTTANTAYIPYASQEDLRPRLAGGSFGPVMTQLQTANLVATWRQTWNSLASRY